MIVPAYNAEGFIEKTLYSILNQTYSNIEVIVVDDGSEDQTANIILSLAQQDQRLVLVQQPNAGVAAARNLGIEKSRGELIAPIDADDIWYPQNLEKQVQRLRQDSSIGLVYSWSVDIDEDDVLTGEFRAAAIEGNVYKTLICHNFIGNSSASLFRRACIERLGAYNGQLKAQQAQGCEDWELYLRIAEHYQFGVVPEFLVGYRKISGSMSKDYTTMAKSHSLMLQDIRHKHPEINSALFRLSCSSFYIYLARQSHLQGKHQETLFWLYQALKSDWVTPVWRYGLYTLSAKSLLGLLRQQTGGNTLALANQREYPVQVNDISLTDFSQRKTIIGFKLLVGNLLHRLLLLV
ncbi:MAG: glycosyltransferase family 2 protein [Cyanophyceae cyanobacterium]